MVIAVKDISVWRLWKTNNSENVCDWTQFFLFPLNKCTTYWCSLQSLKDDCRLLGLTVVESKYGYEIVVADQVGS